MAKSSVPVATGACGAKPVAEVGVVIGNQGYISADTEGLVPKVRVHRAKVPDLDGLRLPLESVRSRLPRLSHLRLDAGYQAWGKDQAENVPGLSVELMHRTPKPTP